METKICSKCGVVLPKTTEYFTKRKTCKDGLSGYCKKCETEYKKQWAIKNKERISEKNKKRYRENRESIISRVNRYRNTHKEVVAERKKQYRETHKEQIKEYFEKNKEHIKENKKQYRDKNKQHIKDYRKKYFLKEESKIRRKKWNAKYSLAHKEEIAEYQQKYYSTHDRIEKRRKVKVISEQKRRSLKQNIENNFSNEQWDKIKQCFNNKCAYCGKELPLTQEHFVPLSKGGEYTINNIIPVCKSCNSSKNNKDFFKWYPKYRHYSKKREKAILDFLGYKDDKQQLSLL